MRTHRPLTPLAVILFASLLLTAPMLAAEPFARTIVSADEIAWQPAETFASADLTVSAPDGRVHSFHFREGDPLRLRPADVPGGSQDGSYVFELRLNPRPVRGRVGDGEPTRTRDANARRSGVERGLPGGSTRVMSGAFNVRGGLLVDGDEAEEPGPDVETAPAPGSGGVVAQPEDQQILDDLIVVGSACVGQDCVNGEVFGFDTIRMKENNLRITFVDTSVSASFPTTDWQLTANDSANGGLNRFSIEDLTAGTAPLTVLGTAPSNSIYVDAGGRLGLRTATPVVDMHMKMGNTPTLRLDQDGTQGFPPRAWDLGGNEVSFFIRDVTANSLRLQINPDGSWTTSTGATLTAGGAWTNASSAVLKQDVADLDAGAATQALRDLRPVTFAYKADPTEQNVGFISEEVPDLVATNDRQGLSPMDVVAVLTKVVQEQQKTIDELSARLAELERTSEERK